MSKRRVAHYYHRLPLYHAQHEQHTDSALASRRRGFHLWPQTSHEATVDVDNTRARFGLWHDGQDARPPSLGRCSQSLRG